MRVKSSSPHRWPLRLLCSRSVLASSTPCAPLRDTWVIGAEVGTSCGGLGWASSVQGAVCSPGPHFLQWVVLRDLDWGSVISGKPSGVKGDIRLGLRQHWAFAVGEPPRPDELPYQPHHYHPRGDGVHPSQQGAGVGCARCLCQGGWPSVLFALSCGWTGARCFQSASLFGSLWARVPTQVSGSLMPSFPLSMSKPQGQASYRSWLCTLQGPCFVPSGLL